MSVFLPIGPAGQLANASFLVAALVSDVLLIRLFLCLAYLWLLISASLGLPKWPSMEPTGGLAADTLTWACLCLFFHGFSLTRLLWDERRIRFQTEDEEQLWRFFYRRSGMGRLEFKQVLKYGSWLRVQAGKPIMAAHEAHLRFYVLVEGLASLQHAYHGVQEPPRLQYSGCCFDQNLLNLFGIYIHFEKNEAHLLSVEATTDCLLYCWSAEDLTAMATRTAPAVGSFWRSLALCQLGMYYGNRSHQAQPLLCATGELESEYVLYGGRSRDFTAELRNYESQKGSLLGIWRWLRRSFHPFPPPGLRHNQLPITGIMARNRLIALKTAKATAAIRLEGSASGWSVLEASEASAHGGRLAWQYLSAMDSLRRIDATTVEEIVQEVVASPRRHSTDGRSGHSGRSPGGSLGGTPRKLSLGLPRRSKSEDVEAAAAAAAAAVSSLSSSGGGGGGNPSGSGSRHAGSSTRSGSAGLHSLLARIRTAPAGTPASGHPAAPLGSPPNSLGTAAVCRTVNAGSLHGPHPMHSSVPSSGDGGERAAASAGMLLSQYNSESRGGNSGGSSQAVELQAQGSRPPGLLPAASSMGATRAGSQRQRAGGHAPQVNVRPASSAWPLGRRTSVLYTERDLRDAGNPNG